MSNEQNSMGDETQPLRLDLEPVLRDPLALAMLAAWVNIPVDKLPESMKAHTCAATMAAWKRVGDAAVAFIAARPYPARDKVLDEAAREAEADRRSDVAKECGYSPSWHSYGQQIAKRIRALKAQPPSTMGEDAEEAEDALAMYRALQNVERVYAVSGIRPSTDVPFSWYVSGPEGEVAFCQTEDGERHADMIAAALNDRVAMLKLPANDAAPKPTQPSIDQAKEPPCAS